MTPIVVIVVAALLVLSLAGWGLEEYKDYRRQAKWEAENDRRWPPS